MESWKSGLIETKLGNMVAIADDASLIALEFADKKNLRLELEALVIKERAQVTSGENAILQMLRDELNGYFKGSLMNFSTPIRLIGTEFQKQVWHALIKTPYGITSTYKLQATSIGRAKSYRAVASANGANRLAIVVPCHRIIGSNGHLSGYAGGIEKKRLLIEHERLHCKA